MVNNKSTLRPIRTGVPQGSFLGALLFLFYVIYIHKISSNLQTILFADDAAISISDQNYPQLVSNLNDGLMVNVKSWLDVKSWTDATRLTVNVNKTQAIVNTGRKPHGQKLYGQKPHGQRQNPQETKVNLT